jgi:hypothetical protein
MSDDGSGGIKIGPSKAIVKPRAVRLSNSHRARWYAAEVDLLEMDDMMTLDIMCEIPPNRDLVLFFQGYYIGWIDKLGKVYVGDWTDNSNDDDPNAPQGCSTPYCEDCNGEGCGLCGDTGLRPEKPSNG